MIKIYCDRCGKEIEDIIYYSAKILIEELSMAESGSFTETKYTITDCCRDCQEEIKNFIKTKNFSDFSFKDDDYIYFGSYPQSKVTDSVIIAKLEKLAPDWDNWTSYGYYSSESRCGTIIQGDWMRYIDVTYNGEKYRGVKFIQYRPSWTCGISSDSYQDGNGGYSIGTIYWFKFESLKWRVLDADTGLILCETIIDSQPYSNTIYSNGGGTYGYFNDPSYTNYASDYETSSIRKWLNNDFYNTAFTSADQSAIATTTLNNDGYYTLTGDSNYTALDSADTNDKIFLMSYDEANNNKYFSSDATRQARGSDYAKCQGLYVSISSSYKENSDWFLRSSGFYSDFCCKVSFAGFVGPYCSVDRSCHGVRPALKLKLGENYVK